MFILKLSDNTVFQLAFCPCLAVVSRGNGFGLLLIRNLSWGLFGNLTFYRNLKMFSKNMIFSVFLSHIKLRLRFRYEAINHFHLPCPRPASNHKWFPTFKGVRFVTRFYETTLFCAQKREQIEWTMTKHALITVCKTLTLNSDSCRKPCKSNNQILTPMLKEQDITNWPSISVVERFPKMFFVDSAQDSTSKWLFFAVAFEFGIRFTPAVNWELRLSCILPWLRCFFMGGAQRLRMVSLPEKDYHHVRYGIDL